MAAAAIDTAGGGLQMQVDGCCFIGAGREPY